MSLQLASSCVQDQRNGLVIDERSKTDLATLPFCIPSHKDSSACGRLLSELQKAGDLAGDSDLAGDNSLWVNT